MTTELERRLAEFVNREEETERFCRLLDQDRKYIMSIWGEGGVGKSSFLAKMLHECAVRRLPRAEVVWTDTRNHDYLGVMRRIRDDLGPAYFTRFTDLTNFFTVPQYELKVTVEGVDRIDVASGAHIEGSTVGDIGGIIIKDLMLSSPRTDMAVPETERMARLTDVFIDEMGTALGELGLTVIFFDAMEKASEDTELWLWNELLGAVLNGRLSGVRCVLSGRRKPSLSREWSFVVEEAQLTPLSHEHIVDYLAKRGVEERSRSAIADMLLVTTQGNVLQIATYVDAFIQLQEGRAGHVA